MSIFRYSEWDGTQELFDLDKDELMDELARNLMFDGDMEYSLWKMQRHGMRDSQGRRLPGLQDLIQRLRQRKQGQLDKYNLSSVMDEIRKKLEDVLKTEREGIQKRLEEARQKASEGGQETEAWTVKCRKSCLSSWRIWPPRTWRSWIISPVISVGR